MAWRYLWSRPLAAALNLLLLTLGLAAITLVLLVSTQLDRAFERDLEGIRPGSGRQGQPAAAHSGGGVPHRRAHGQRPLQEVQALQQNPLVAQVVPLSLGDSYQGYRIVGTTPDYVAHYRANLAEGTLWQQPMEAVLGASAARAHRQTRSCWPAPGGATFIGSHGLAGRACPWRSPLPGVSGVLAPCGCVLGTGSTFTSTESVWQVHEAATADDPEDLEILKQEREVTVALVRYPHTAGGGVAAPCHQRQHLDAGRRTGH